MPVTDCRSTPRGVGMVLPLAADRVVFKGKPKKGGADEGTAVAYAGGVCVLTNE